MSGWRSKLDNLADRRARRKLNVVHDGSRGR
jgi:hypothetical protein